MSRKNGSDDSSQVGGRRGRPSLWYRVSQNFIDVALWVLGVLGLLSLLAAIAAQIWGLSIILFSTGSMSPTIPAGSAALVQRIPASEVKVGDVVTVERRDALPVTHRVTSVAQANGSATAYVITMRGDANSADDANPYQVTEVRRVLYSVPGVAVAINRLRSPLVIGGATVVAGVLVTWAFWPRRPSGPVRVAEESGESEATSDPDDAVSDSSVAGGAGESSGGSSSLDELLGDSAPGESTGP
jgi:signal peptidase I